jgi:hypothetical protein
VLGWLDWICVCAGVLGPDALAKHVHYAVLRAGRLLSPPCALQPNGLACEVWVGIHARACQRYRVLVVAHCIGHHARLGAGRWWYADVRAMEEMEAERDDAAAEEEDVPTKIVTAQVGLAVRAKVGRRARLRCWRIYVGEKRAHGGRALQGRLKPRRATAAPTLHPHGVLLHVHTEHGPPRAGRVLRL